MLLDKDIREPLFEFLEATYGKVRIFEEKMMGRSRADVCMITEDRIMGIEIKSDADSYARLSRQIKDYDLYFDRNLVVVGGSHGTHIAEHVPDWWGIITVDETPEGKADFYFLRQPLDNPLVTWERKIQILWRPELVQLQEWNDMPRYKEKSKAFVQEKILARLGDQIPEERLRRQFCQLLFERDYQTIGETLDQYRKENSPTRTRQTKKRGIKRARRAMR